MDAKKLRPYSRPLRFEPLESRRLLSITVDTLVDENNGVGSGAGTSLREAIAAAVAGDTIDFSVTGTINLSVGASNSTKQLSINKSLTISGPGASLLTIKAFDPTTATKNGDGSRVFTIDDSSSTTVRDVSISGLTLTGGDAATSGGAISSAENLVVTDCVISGNNTGMLPFSSGAGGGIFSQATPSLPNSLTIRGSTLTGNTAPASEGGAIRQRYGQLVIENCTISNNSAATGGGVSVGRANVQVSGSTFSANSATSSSTSSRTGGAITVANTTISISDSTISGNSSAIGGGIYANSTSSSTTVSISNSVLSTNTASVSGGGVATSYSTLSIINCTLSGNTATSSGGGAINTANSPLTVKNSTLSGNSARIGGAIQADQGTAFGVPPSLIENSTISGNTAIGTMLTDLGAIYAVRPMLIRFCTITGNTTPAGRRGAVGSFGGGFTITVYSSIIAGNTNGDIGYNNSPSPFISLGYNLIGTGNNSSLASFNQAGDQTGVLNPMLGALANNGGSTMTRMPLAGSPAIDAGDPAAVAGAGVVPLYDQRGAPFTRVYDGDGAGGGRIDIGAVELQVQPLPAAVFGDYNGDHAVDTADFAVWRKTFGTSDVPAYSGADGNGDRVVDEKDYSVWRAHFGQAVPVTGAGSGASVEWGVGSVEGGAREVTVALAGASSGDSVDEPAALAGVNVEVKVQADVTRARQSEPGVGATFGTAGRASSGTHLRALAGPVVPVVSRDDALVAWLAVRGDGRGGASKAAVAVTNDESGRDVTDELGALDVAFAAMVSAAVR